MEMRYANIPCEVNCIFDIRHVPSMIAFALCVKVCVWWLGCGWFIKDWHFNQWMNLEVTSFVLFLSGFGVISTYLTMRTKNPREQLELFKMIIATYMNFSLTCVKFYDGNCIISLAFIYMSLQNSKLVSVWLTAKSRCFLNLYPMKFA